MPPPFLKGDSGGFKGTHDNNLLDRWYNDRTAVCLFACRSSQTGNVLTVNMRQKISIWISVFLLFFLLYWTGSFSKAEPPNHPERMGELPEFKLVSALTGQTLSKEYLLGKCWVASFIFTRCGGPCPLISSNMAHLQSDLPKEIFLVTVTVDPDWDTPKILSRYAENFKADKNRWFFLTGNKKDIYSLVSDGFKLSIMQDPKKPVSGRVVHSTKLVLLDKNGYIRGYYDGTDKAFLDRIRSDALKILKE